MELQLFQVDAFTHQTFGGNPAAVCPLESWLPDDILQKIATENNLSETAFFIPDKWGYHIRWFTPGAEVKLCGHATLATAYVIFNFLNKALDKVTFQSLSGPLHVYKQAGGMMMDFPVWDFKKAEAPQFLIDALGAVPDEFYLSHDAMAIFNSPETMKKLTPDLAGLAQYDQSRGIIITAPGDNDFDFISRTFYPRLGVPEDPVTGSAHCVLTPYWAQRLGKNPLKARQVSSRGGDLLCKLAGNRVEITGDACLYLKGSIYI